MEVMRGDKRVFVVFNNKRFGALCTQAFFDKFERVSKHDAWKLAVSAKEQAEDFVKSQTWISNPVIVDRPEIMESEQALNFAKVNHSMKAQPAKPGLNEVLIKERSTK